MSAADGEGARAIEGPAGPGASERVERRGPSARWFVERAMIGRAPKLAIVDAAIATAIAIVAAMLWRVSSGSHGTFESIVPMLGTSLRWSVALPIAWGALGAVRDDREAGLVDLALRRGVRARSWLIGRALGAGTLVTIAVGAPMVATSIVLAGFGGGVEGALARASLIVPSCAMAVVCGVVFGVGGVVFGALFSTRMVAIAVIAAMSALGAIVDRVVPGIVGAAAHQLVSPFRALEDLQAGLFDAPGSIGRAVAAACALIVLSAVGLHVAAATFEEEHVGGAS